MLPITCHLFLTLKTKELLQREPEPPSLVRPTLLSYAIPHFPSGVHRTVPLVTNTKCQTIFTLDVEQSVGQAAGLCGKIIP